MSDRGTLGRGWWRSRGYLLLLLLMIGSAQLFSQTCMLEKGDLLFVVGKEQSDWSEAIKAATSDAEELPFSHVGIVTFEEEGCFVIEATALQGVVMTPLDLFIEQAAQLNGEPLVAVGRLNAPIEPGVIDRALSFAHAMIGRDYDEAYDESNDRFYCSELVRKAFTTQEGEAIFPPIAMSFKNKTTNSTDPYWIKHYKRLQLEIPEGMPGSNPKALSRAAQLHLVHRYYHLQEDSMFRGE